MTCTTLSDDVHNVLREYIAAIGAKDADIFNLYDTNIHLRGLLDEAVKRTQMIEEELQQEQRKVQMNDTEMKSLREEKTSLQKERDELAEFKREVHVLLLDMPNTNVKDLVAWIREMQSSESMLTLQREKCEREQLQLYDSLFRELHRTEECCRQVIIDVYDEVSSKLIKEFNIILSNTVTTTQLLQLEKTTQLEQSTHIIQQMEFELERRKTSLKSTRRKLDVAESKAEFLSQDLEQAHSKIRCMAEFFNVYSSKAESLTALLVARVFEAENAWMESLNDSKHLHIAENVITTQQLNDSTKNYKETIAVLEQKVKECNTTLCTHRTSVAAKDELVKKYKESNDELRRAKEQTSVLLQRQRSLATKREAVLRKSKDEVERQLAKLQQESRQEKEIYAKETNELRASITECKLLNNSLEESNKQLETELRKTQSAMVELEHRLEAMQQLEEHQCNVQSLLSELKSEYESKVKQLQCEYDAKQESKARELERAECQFAFSIRAKEEEVTRVHAEWTEKYNTLQANANDEIREWVEIAEKWKADAHFLHDQLNKEREIRELLESQQCNESQLLRHILDTPISTNRLITTSQERKEQQHSHLPAYQER